MGEFGGDVEALAAATEDLVHPAAASSGTVVYAQLGGVTGVDLPDSVIDDGSGRP